jgi:hypothetical protein
LTSSSLAPKNQGAQSSELIRLNLGCGFNRSAGFVNVDKFAGCNPDMVLDLEAGPWPWADSSVQEIRMNHVLEHLGQSPDLFLSIVSEVYRILAPGGVWTVTVPHPRHDDFLSDPTHVRAITPTTLEMFDRKKNEAWVKASLSTTPLAIMTGVDFAMDSVTMIPDEVWAERLQKGQISQDDLSSMLWHSTNIAREISMKLHARKPSLVISRS